MKISNKLIGILILIVDFLLMSFIIGGAAYLIDSGFFDFISLTFINSLLFGICCVLFIIVFVALILGLFISATSFLDNNGYVLIRKAKKKL